MVPRRVLQAVLAAILLALLLQMAFTAQLSVPGLVGLGLCTLALLTSGRRWSVGSTKRQLLVAVAGFVAAGLLMGWAAISFEPLAMRLLMLVGALLALFVAVTAAIALQRVGRHREPPENGGTSDTSTQV